MAKRSVHHALIACIGHKSTSLVVRTRGVDGQASNVIFFHGLMEDGIDAGLIEILCSLIGYTSSCIALTPTARNHHARSHIAGCRWTAMYAEIAPSRTGFTGFPVSSELAVLPMVKLFSLQLQQKGLELLLRLQVSKPSPADL